MMVNRCVNHFEFEVQFVGERLAIGEDHMDPQLHIDDNYAVKQNLLVDLCTAQLRGILLQKRDRWIAATKSNLERFLERHPQKKWHKSIQDKLKSPDFVDFDLPLCARWLIEFPWFYHEAALSKGEVEAIEKLRGIRNATKHKGSSTSVTEAEYVVDCDTVMECLLALGFTKSVIDEIIRKADAVTLVNKEDILNRFRTLTDEEWRFETVGVLGGGCFGVVVRVLCPDRRYLALKMIPNRRGKKVGEDELREARILASLEPHPNVMRYVTSNYFRLSAEKFQETIEWENGENQEYPDQTHDLVSACLNSARTLTGCYILTEVCGETLRAWLRNSIGEEGELRTDAAKYQIAEDIFNGLDFIHNGQRGNVIVHRDLRPDNIYFSKPGFQFPVKIGDFGLSTAILAYVDATQTRQVGNSFYRAPEVDNPHPNLPNSSKGKYGPPADLFSAGLIMAEIFDPVQETDLRRKFEQIRFDRDTGDIKESDPLVSDFILRLTDRKNPDQRYPLGLDGRYVRLPWSLSPMPNSETQQIQPELQSNDIQIQSNDKWAIPMNAIREVYKNMGAVVIGGVEDDFVCNQPIVQRIIVLICEEHPVVLRNAKVLCRDLLVSAFDILEIEHKMNDNLELGIVQMFEIWLSKSTTSDKSYSKLTAILYNYDTSLAEKLQLPKVKWGLRKLANR